MRSSLTATAVAALTLFAACGDDEGVSSSGSDVTAAASEAGAAPTTTLAAAPATGGTTAGTGGASSAADAPQAIVSLAATHTEILFAIGAGDQVIAVDDQSNFPPEADAVRTDLSGFEPNVEAIAGYEPDLVVLSEDPIQAQLESLGIDVWVGPAAMTLEDTYDQIEQLGALTGHEAEAAALVADMRAEMDAITASVSPPVEPLTVFHELDDTGFTVDSTTFIGSLYSRLGLQNIADRTEGDHGGYPQLNAETIIAADPDLIFLADTKCCGVTPENVAARPGWSAISAVANERVFAMDDDVASRWGPRVVDYYRQVAEAIATVADDG
jgi:iron complex transport system substrate-binding protein